MANTVSSNVPNLSGAKSTATAASNAATLHAQIGAITSEALTTAQNSTYTCTVTNSYCGTGSIVLATICNGTNSAATPVLLSAKPGAGSFVVIVANKHDSSVTFNGTIVINFVVL